MQKVEEAANDYAKEVGDDCLCKRTTPDTYYGECIYLFCGCNIAEAFKAGSKWQQTMDYINEYNQS